MKEAAKQFWSDFYNSLKVNQHGFSSKKLTAFIVCICVIVAHVSWLEYSFLNKDYSLLTTVLTIDFGFIASLLGVSTYENMKKAKEQEIKSETEKNNQDIG